MAINWGKPIMDKGRSDNDNDESKQKRRERVTDTQMVKQMEFEYR